MKGQSKRYVDHKGEAYDTKLDNTRRDHIGFFDLWRYAEAVEVMASVGGALLALLCSGGLVGAIVLYGELTSLFVQRHRAQGTTPHAHILGLFGGGDVVSEGNRTVYMDALVDDSVAFAYASAAIMSLQLLAAALAVYLANWAAQRQITRVRYKLLSSVLRQEMAWFDTNTTMNFAANLTDDTEKLRAGIGDQVSMCAYLGGSVVCGAAFSLLYGWQLTLVGLAVVPFSIAQAALVSKYQTRCSNRELAAYGLAGRVVEEAVAGVRTVVALGGEEREVERYAEALRPAHRQAVRRGAWSAAGAGLGWLLTYTLNSVVFAYGATLIVRDMDLPPAQQEYHPGIMLTVLFCTFMAAQNIAMCHPHLETFSVARGAAKNVFELLERCSTIDAAEHSGIAPAVFRGEVVFDDVYFNYPSRPDVKVLRGLSLRVRPGETVALVGGSGCGKSTVLQLLQRLYEPESGTVAVDGHRLADLDLHHYRTSIGVVGQEPVLFGGTVRENIALGLDGVSEERIMDAAKLANAHDFIMKLAKGYDTVIGSRGAQLSGGQKQRVAIARGVIRSPALLLLDEPTSALDHHAERRVQAALDRASEGRTTIVVSHRLSTVVKADRIVYMEQGAVLEQGSHAELMEMRGHYWKLVQADLANKSAAEVTLAENDAEEDDGADEEEASDEPRRHFDRSATVRATLTPERTVRGSHRLGSVASAHLPNAAAPELHADTGPDEEGEEDVSSGRLLRLNAPEWPLLVAGGVASLVVGATMPTFALLFSKLYGMFSISDGDEIVRVSRVYAGLFMGVAALCGLVTFLQSWLFNLAGTRLTTRLRRVTFANFLRQEMGWFDRPSNSVGALCARLARDCAAVQGATGARLGTVLQGVSTLLLGVTLATVYSWKMTLVSLVSVPVVMGGIYLEGYAMQRSAVRERRAIERAADVATEAVLNVRTVQSLGVEARVLARYEAALHEARAMAGRGARLRGPVYGLCLCAPTLGYAVSLAYGGYLIAREDMPYEYAILVSEALIYGAWMLGQALSFAPNFSAARRSGARIIRLMSRRPAIATPDCVPDRLDWTAKGDVEFESVQFRYPTRPRAQVLRGLSLKLEAGRTVGLVGASGCGKSTLMQLLMRFYDPGVGTVMLDGLDVSRELTLPRLRAQLGLVQQEPVLFDRSIRENIAYGDNSREVGMDEIVEAAEKANVHAFIAGLPMGYETRLGGGGAHLSGGQKQRIAIARALVRDPRVLLLDEATSALDANSEKTVQAALESAARGRTTVIIAHRLATVRHADTICVIDKGAVAERGSHEELLRRRGLYYRLYRQQTAPDL